MRKSMFAAIIVALLATACSIGGTGSADVSSPSRLRQLLAHVPRSVFDDGPIFASDWALALDQGNIIRRPDGCGTDDEVPDFLNELIQPNSPEVYLPRLLQHSVREPQTLEASFGFGFCDLDAVAESSLGGTGVFIVDASADSIDQAINADPEWSDLLDVVNGGADDAYYQWGGDDSFQLGQRSALRPLGRGGQLAVRGDTASGNVVIRTVDPDVMEDALRGRTVADNDDVSEMLDVFEAEAVHTVLLSADIPVIGPDLFGGTASPEALAEAEARAGEALLGYSMLGLGVGYDPAQREPYAIVILEARSEADAIENVDRFRRQVAQGTSFRDTLWSQHLSIESIEAQGELTVARLRATEQNRLLWSFITNAYYGSDTLFLSN